MSFTPTHLLAQRFSTGSRVHFRSDAKAAWTHDGVVVQQWAEGYPYQVQVAQEHSMRPTAPSNEFVSTPMFDRLVANTC